MQYRRLSALLAVSALFGLGCQIAALFAAAPTPTAPRAVQNNLPAPTPLPIVPTLAPTAVRSSPTLTAAPTAAAQSPCTNPSAAITFPLMNSTVSGLIEIRGTATRPDLQYWKVEYRPDASTVYLMLNNSDKGALDAVLARWSTRTVPNGVYWIQLIVVAKDGNFGTPCQIRVNIAN